MLEERDAAQDLGLALDVGRFLVVARLHRESDGGHVVLAAALEREVDQQVGELVLLLREQRGQFLLAQVAVQPVGAEQVDVAGQQIGHQRVHRHARLDAHRPGDDVLVLRARHFLLADQPALELLLDHGVVLGELVRAVLAEEVDAAVPDVPHHRLSPGDE